MEQRHSHVEHFPAAFAQDRFAAGTEMIELSPRDLDAVGGGETTTTTVKFRRNGSVKSITTTTVD